MGTVEVRADHRDLHILRCDREERGVRGGHTSRKAQLLPQAPSSSWMQRTFTQERSERSHFLSGFYESPQNC